MTRLDPTILAGSTRPRRSRTFFLGMSAFAIFILTLAFAPEYRRFFGGTFRIAGVLHVHAAIMMSWVAAFGLQAFLGATGRNALHRQVGRYAVAIGWLAWVSMIFVEFRTYVTYPLSRTDRDLDWDLPGPHVYLTFAIFLAWAVHERRRPAWHKRLMTFALFVSLTAAMERYVWVPMDFGFGPFAALLDCSLLLPMIGYDLYTAKLRLHAATIYGMLVLLASQTLLFALWGTGLWHRFAFAVARAIHG